MVSLRDICEYCQSFEGAFAEYPFGSGALVYKFRGKMFILIQEDEIPL
ncbi:MAG: hypothetical protein JXA19_00270 [Anaerolineales bacterium]|nr:hypothetical protein [Anaerolineales bacterium]